MNLHELYTRAVAAHDPRDIEDFLCGAQDFVRYTVFSLLKRRNMHVHQWLADDVSADVTALVGEKIGRLLRGDIRNIGGFLYRLAEHEVTDSVDNALRPCGLGPCARTRKRRRDRNEDEFAPGELHKRVYYQYERGNAEDGVFNPTDVEDEFTSNFPIEYNADSHYRSSSIGDNFVARSYRRGRNEEYDNFVAWIEQAAWQHVGDDPKMRLAFAHIKLSRDDEPKITEIAAKVGMSRSTLRYRLDRLAERVYQMAPDWVHRAGRVYLRESWAVPEILAVA